MMDKGYGDDTPINRNECKALYPQNVLNGGGGLSVIKDTILHEEVYRILHETYAEFIQGPLVQKYTYLYLPTTAEEDKTPTIAPTPYHVFYPPPTSLTTDYDKKTVIINAYLRLPPPKENQMLNYSTHRQEQLYL